MKIYRLITRNTYEREMFDRASMKLGLDHAVLSQLSDASGGGDKSGEKTSEEARKLTSKEVDQLLKKGAYSILKGILLVASYLYFHSHIPFLRGRLRHGEVLRAEHRPDPLRTHANHRPRVDWRPLVVC